MTDLTISRVKRLDFPLIWLKLLPQIRRGLSKGAGDTLTEEGLSSAVMHETVDVWVAHTVENEIVGACFLQIDQRARGKALFVLLSVGQPGTARRCTEAFLPRLRDYAEMIGAYTVESWSRPGAARLLAQFGCKPKAMIMELNDVRRTQQIGYDTEARGRDERHGHGHTGSGVASN